MVFLSSCNSVKYHAELLNYVDIPVRDIHGKQKQAKRTSTFFEFCSADTGTLLCTDVAARGLDIPGAPVMGWFMRCIRHCIGIAKIVGRHRMLAINIMTLGSICPSADRM